ncbi:MAG: hypothetical protein V1858_00420, partial [Candidatus Gottesmanbacteria bacterium]
LHGTTNDTAVIDTAGSLIPNDAEIALGAGGQGDWCKPSDTMTPFNLDRQGNPTSIFAIEGEIFTTTGDNSSGYPFTKITSTNPTALIEAGYIDGYKSYGVFADPNNPNTAYIGTDTKGEEVIFIDLTQQTGLLYSKKGYFDADIQGGKKTARTVYIISNVGYVTIDNNLYSFDVTQSGKTKLSGPINLSGNGTKILIKEEYAFITNSSTNNQLEIFQISADGKTIDRRSQIHLDGGGATDVAVNDTGTRAYVVTSAVSGKNNLFIINTENKSNPFLISSFNADGVDPKGVAIVPNRVIVVGTDNGGKEYQVIKIDNDDSPSYCNADIGIDIPSGIYGIATVFKTGSNAYSYIITGDASAEIRIIQGGPGGQFAASGSYESSSFDSGYPTAFNRLLAHVNQPDETTVRLQVAVADSVNNSCSDPGVNFTYVGPDADHPFYLPVNNIISGPIPYTTVDSYHNPGRCFRYKVYLSTLNTNQTPSFKDLEINYSP